MTYNAFSPTAKEACVMFGLTEAELAECEKKIIKLLLGAGFTSEDCLFVDKAEPDLYTANQYTKIECACLLGMGAFSNVQRNFETRIRHIDPSEIRTLPRGQNAQHLFAQLYKASTDTQTEGFKGFCSYNNGYSFIRTYKLVGEPYFKLEITRVPLGQRAGLQLKTTVKGAKELMMRLLNGAENHMLPYWLHNKNVTPVSYILSKRG